MTPLQVVPTCSVYYLGQNCKEEKNCFYDELCVCERVSTNVYALYRSPSKHLLAIFLFSLCVFLCVAAAFKYALLLQNLHLGFIFI